MGLCTTSLLASTSVCPFGDDVVQDGTQGVALSSEFVSCTEFISVLIKNGKSEAAFCSSTEGQESCCSTCLSIL